MKTASSCQQALCALCAKPSENGGVKQEVLLWIEYTYDECEYTV